MSSTTELSLPAMIARSNPIYDACQMARELCSRVGDMQASKIQASTDLKEYFTQEDLRLHGPDFLKLVLNRISFANLIRETGLAWINRNITNKRRLAQVGACNTVQELFTESEVKRHGEPLLDSVLEFLKESLKDNSRPQHVTTSSVAASGASTAMPLGDTNYASQSSFQYQPNVHSQFSTVALSQARSTSGDPASKPAAQARRRASVDQAVPKSRGESYSDVQAVAPVQYHRVFTDPVRQNTAASDQRHVSSGSYQASNMTPTSMHPQPVALTSIYEAAQLRGPPSTFNPQAANRVTPGGQMAVGSVQAALPIMSQSVHPELMANTVHGNILRRQAFAAQYQGVPVVYLQNQPDATRQISQTMSSPVFGNSTAQVVSPAFVSPGFRMSQMYYPSAQGVPTSNGGQSMGLDSLLAYSMGNVEQAQLTQPFNPENRHGGSLYERRNSIRGRGRGRGRGSGPGFQGSRQPAEAQQTGWRDNKQNITAVEHGQDWQHRRPPAQQAQSQWAFRQSPTLQRSSLPSETFPPFSPTADVPPGQRVMRDSIGPDVEHIHRLHIHSLPSDSTPGELKTFIERHVAVDTVQNLRAGIHRTGLLFTFVNFFSTSDVRKALQLVNKSEFKGRTIYAEVCKQDINFEDDSSSPNSRRFSHGYSGGQPTSPVQPRKAPDLAKLRLRTDTIVDKPEAYSPQDARSGDFHRGSAGCQSGAESEKPSNSTHSSPSKKIRKKSSKSGTQSSDTVHPLEIEPTGDRVTALTVAAMVPTLPREGLEETSRNLASIENTGVSLTHDDNSLDPALGPTPPTRGIPVPAFVKELPEEEESGASQDTSTQDSSTSLAVPIADRGTSESRDMMDLEPAGPLLPHEASLPLSPTSSPCDHVDDNIVQQTDDKSVDREDKGGERQRKTSPKAAPNETTVHLGLATEQQAHEAEAAQSVIGSQDALTDEVSSHSRFESLLDKSTEATESVNTVPRNTSSDVVYDDSGMQKHESPGSPKLQGEGETHNTSATDPEYEQGGKDKPTATAAPASHEAPATTIKPTLKKAGPSQTESLHPFAAAKQQRKQARQAKKKERKKAKVSGLSSTPTSSNATDGLSDITNWKSLGAPEQEQQGNDGSKTFLDKAEPETQEGGLKPRPRDNSALVVPSKPTSSSEYALSPLSDAPRQIDYPPASDANLGSPKRPNFFSQVRDVVPNLFGFDFGRTKSPTRIRPKAGDEIISLEGSQAAPRLALPGMTLEPHVASPSTPHSRIVSGESFVSALSHANTPDALVRSSEANRTSRADSFTAHLPSSSLVGPKKYIGDGTQVHARNDDTEIFRPSTESLEVGLSFPPKHDSRETDHDKDDDEHMPSSPPVPLDITGPVPKLDDGDVVVIDLDSHKPKKKKRKSKKKNKAAEASIATPLADSTPPSSAEQSPDNSDGARPGQDIEVLKSNLFVAIVEHELMKVMTRMLDIDDKPAALGMAVKLGECRGRREELPVGVPAQPYTLAVTQYTDEYSRRLLSKSLEGEIKQLSKVSGVSAREYVALQKDAEKTAARELKDVKRKPNIDLDAARLEAEKEKQRIEEIREQQRKSQEQFRSMCPNITLINYGPLINTLIFNNNNNSDELSGEPSPSGYRGLGVGDEHHLLPIGEGQRNEHMRHRGTGFVESEETSDNEQVVNADDLGLSRSPPSSDGLIESVSADGYD